MLKSPILSRFLPFQGAFWLLLVFHYVPVKASANTSGLQASPSSLSNAWTQGPATDNVFGGFGNPAGLAFTPGLQLGLIHQTNTSGDAQQIDLFSSLKLDALSLGLGYYNDLFASQGPYKEQYRLVGAIDLGGSAIGGSWNGLSADPTMLGQQGAWSFAAINRSNAWFAQSASMTGNTSSLHGFDLLNAGVSLRPFGLFWTVGAEATVDVWNSWNTDIAIHNWFKFGNFNLMASVTQMTVAQTIDPVLSIGIAYRGGHLGLGTSSLFSAQQMDPLIATHARISSARMTQGKGLIPEFVDLTLFGAGQAQLDADQISTLFEASMTPQETLLSVDKTMKSSKTAGIVIRLNGLQMGFGQALEWQRSIKQWRALGKKVVVYLERPGDLAYFLATAADAIWLSPSGTLMVDGVSITSLYFGEALAEIGVQAQAIAAGQYKTAPRQYTGNAPSPEEIEVFKDLADQYYKTLLGGLTEGRGFNAEEAAQRLNQGGFTAQEAISNKMVDQLIYPSDLEEGLKTLMGKRVWLSNWRQEMPQYRAQWEQPKNIAVIPILGTIMNGQTESDFFGNSNTSATGASTVIEAIEEAVDRPDINAIVLRVDSPGGDAMASDHIYHAVRKANKKKPVIVSMGNYAASGGYYVSAPAREIFAQPLTLTGSIGVFALTVNIEETLKKLKIGRFDLQRGELQAPSMTRAMNDAEIARLQQQIDATYIQFLDAVSQGRDMKREEVAPLAEGRVWTGAQAHENGLVDKIGHFQDAVTAAAKAAGLDPFQDTIELIVLGGGGEPLTQGFQAFAKLKSQPSLTQLALQRLGLSKQEISFWMSDGTKAHLPYAIVVE